METPKKVFFGSNKRTNYGTLQPPEWRWRGKYLWQKITLSLFSQKNFGRDKTLPLSLLKQQLAKVIFITMMAGSGDPSLQQPTAKQQQVNNSQHSSSTPLCSQHPTSPNNQQPTTPNSSSRPTTPKTWIVSVRSMLSLLKPWHLEHLLMKYLDLSYFSNLLQTLHRF
jgi:hypothetical protein